MFRKRLILILMMLTMAVSVVPSLVYAEEVANTESTPILLSVKAIGTKKVKLSWNKQKDATKYVIYGNKCGLFSCKKLVTTTSNKYTVKKIKSKKLQAHKSYKFYVVAYNGKTKLAKSKAVHFITGNTNKVYGNVKKIIPKKKSITIKAGQKVKVTAKVKIYKNKKHIKKAHGYGLRFISSNKKIAKVSKTGVVTGVSEGKATIYIQDITGKYCKTKVTVTGSGKKPTPSAEPTPTPTPTPPVEPTYTITFDSNGGTGTMDPQSVVQGGEVTLSANAFTGPIINPDLLVGGRIFFINDEANNNATYIFKDADGNEVTIQSVEELASADSYSIAKAFAGWNTEADGTGTSYESSAQLTPINDMTLYAQWTTVSEYEDKFYVLATNDEGHAIVKSGVQWGAYDTSVGITTDGIGKGKPNTAAALANPNCFADSNLGEQPTGSNTIWTWINGRNEEPLNGCSDWFIPSLAELKELQSGGIQKEYIIDTLGQDYQSLWSSVEFNRFTAYYVRWDDGFSNTTSKYLDSNTYFVWGCVAVRAF